MDQPGQRGHRRRALCPDVSSVDGGRVGRALRPDRLIGEWAMASLPAYRGLPQPASRTHPRRRRQPGRRHALRRTHAPPTGARRTAHAAERPPVRAGLGRDRQTRGRLRSALPQPPRLGVPRALPASTWASYRAAQGLLVEMARTGTNVAAVGGSWRTLIGTSVTMVTVGGRMLLTPASAVVSACGMAASSTQLLHPPAYAVLSARFRHESCQTRSLQEREELR